jgi:hypothetical protein
MEVMTIKEVTDALGFGKEKRDRQKFYALKREPERLEAFVDYFISKKTTNGESGNLELEAKVQELSEKLVFPALTALTRRDCKYVSILPSTLKRNWTQTDSELRFIVQFVLACRRPWGPYLKCGIWYDDGEDDIQYVPLVIEILRTLELEFSEPQIKKSELAQRMDRAARAQLLGFDFGVGREDEDRNLEAVDKENEHAAAAETEALRQQGNLSRTFAPTVRVNGGQVYGIRFYY